MKILWCEEHESKEFETGGPVKFCKDAYHLGLPLGTCRMVAMRLTPDRYPNICPHCGEDLEQPDTLLGGDAMKPIVYMIGSSALEHGERAELDPEHPEACLCGFEEYMLCPRVDEGISSWTIYPAGETL